MIATLRVARPTDDLDALVRFYAKGLGLSVLASFEDHEGFDGVMVGSPELPWHLEFTRRRGHAAGRAPGDEHLLVFYLPDPDAWRAAVDRMLASGQAPVPVVNPWWERHGRTFEDPDGYRVVLWNGAWDPST